MTQHASIVQRYSESWTPSEGGRWRSGVENAVIALHAAGYAPDGPRRWLRQGDNKRLPKRLRVVNVLAQWPHSCTIEIDGRR